MRRLFVVTAIAATVGVLALSFVWLPMLWAFVVVGPLILLGVLDMAQTKQAIRRNFPVIGHARYLLEKIRPEINQYFVESNIDGRPFNRNWHGTPRAPANAASAP